MKKWFFLFTLFFFLPSSPKALTLHFFYGEGCPHCAKEEVYLETLKETYPELEIVCYETWYNEEHAKLLNQVKQTLEKNNPYVPFTVIGTTSITGFHDSSKEAINQALETCRTTSCPNIVEQVKEKGAFSLPKEERSTEDSSDSTISLPFLGTVEVKHVPISLLAIVMGLIDGFNPCAMWILLFLIGLLLGTNDKKKMWVFGLSFLLTSGLVYLLFMLAWLQVALQMNQVIWIRNGIAVLALLGSIWNLRSFFHSSEVGCRVTKESRRTTLQAKMRAFVSEKKFFLGLLGIIVLAFLVNLIELACSAGLPLLFTSILSWNHLSGFSYFGAIFLYLLCYLLDDIVIFAIAMITFELTGISNKYHRYSHLIGGILMLVIGILLLLKPSWLLFG